MGRLLIIGCGGVAGVAIHKCCQNSKTFSEICIASRTKSKCDDLKEKLEKTTETKITTAQVDADNVDELIALIKDYQPDAVLNVALPYQDLTIMDACLACKVDYIDTANYEPEDTDDPQWRAIYEKRCKDEGFTAYFDYSCQWAYQDRFKEAGITALLGSGFDPGVTSVFTAYALVMKLIPLIFWIVMAVIMVILLQRILIRRLICVKYLPMVPIGKMVIGLRQSLWRLNVNMTSLRLDRKICTCFIMRKSNHWPKMYPV